MNKKALPLVVLLAVFMVIAQVSCKKADDENKVTATSKDYFPLEVGKFVIYDVDSTVWDTMYCVTRKYHCQLKYTVAGTFQDGEGRESYRIDIRRRREITDDWAVNGVMWATNTGEELELTYSMLRYIKMRFPVATGTTWKGNAYINTDDADLSYFKDWDYKYVNADEQYDNGSVRFDNTVTILGRDEKINDPETIPKQNASRTFSSEVFAQGVGMVHREFYHWTYDATLPMNNNPYNPNKCRLGLGVVMNAVDHN